MGGALEVDDGLHGAGTAFRGDDLRPEDLELAQLLLQLVARGPEQTRELGGLEGRRRAAYLDFDFEGAHGAGFEFEGVDAHRVAGDGPWLVLE